MRSTWKGNYLSLRTYSYFFLNKKYFLAERNSTIISKFCNSTFYVHTGMYLLKIKISELLENKKFGMYAFTKEIVRHEKKKK